MIDRSGVKMDLFWFLSSSICSLNIQNWSKLIRFRSDLWHCNMYKDSEHSPETSVVYNYFSVSFDSICMNSSIVEWKKHRNKLSVIDQHLLHNVLWYILTYRVLDITEYGYAQWLSSWEFLLHQAVYSSIILEIVKTLSLMCMQ